MNGRFQSLRFRLLGPLVGAALLAAAGVALASYELGGRAVERRVDERFSAIAETLSRASFPFTPPVLETLSGLTGTELATYRADGRLLYATVSNEDAPDGELLEERIREIGREMSRAESGSPPAVPGFLGRAFRREPVRGADDSVSHVLVLFDEAALRRARWQAASLPLATGLSTMLLLSLAAWLLTRPLVNRIAELQRGVERIAAGDFDAAAGLARSDPARGGDELVRLTRAVRTMGHELGTLWQAVHQQERQKLIHQLAAGLAHQLRNSLTGARMAVELHARRLQDAQRGGLDVALRELERTEQFVQRILMIAAEGPQRGDVAGTVDQAIEEVQAALAAVARHQRIDLQWTISEDAAGGRVADVQALAAAVQNLVLNALQAGGDRVSLTADCRDHELEIIVRDNGPGPPELAGGDLFDPFVTSKPEGLGLGLALVRRAAERLGGSVAWHRERGETVFRFVATLAK